MAAQIVFTVVGFLVGVLALLYLFLCAGKPKLPYLPPKDDKVVDLDSARIRKVLGFKPETETKEKLR